MSHRIGVLVVTYNQLNKTRMWINNFLSNEPDSEIVRLLILDNNSTDNTYVTLRKEFPTLDIRLLNANYGCTKGRNIGISELFDFGCDLYCGFDADVFIEDPGFFRKVIQFMDGRPRLDGFTPVLRFYEDLSIQGLGGRRGYLGVMKAITEITNNRSVDYIPGGSSIIRMSSFQKYGIYDNNFPPIGGQDYEWGYRTTQLGGVLEYNPDFEAIHFHEKSAKCSDPIQKRWVIIGRTMFLRKHFSLGHLLREFRYFCRSLRYSNILFVVASYTEGFRKRVNPSDSDFSEFLKSDRSVYYQNQRNR